MALVKLGPEIVSIRGQCGGVYFQRDLAGQQVRAMPRRIKYARVGMQGKNRDAFSAMNYLAGIMAGLGYLILWVAYALRKWWKRKDGRRVKLTWWQWFVHFNMPRWVAGLPPMMKPPDD